MVGVPLHVFQNLAEVGVFFGMVLRAVSLEVIEETMHSVKARLVQRLQQVESSKEEGAGPACRIEHGHVFDTVVKSA
jgi:hypothetical protein